jgi:hypothetical protein
VADYAPVFLPGLTATFTAAGTLIGGDPVEVAGSNTVQKTTAGDTNIGSFKCIGVATHDATAGSRVTVIMDRVVHEGTAEGAINAGDQLMASSLAGHQVIAAPVVSGGAPAKADVQVSRAIIGIALTTAASNGTVRWMQRLNPLASHLPTAGWQVPFTTCQPPWFGKPLDPSPIAG